MKVKIIHDAAQLESLSPFYVDHLLWGTTHIPKTYGYIGFVPGDAFYLKMICEETDPLRTYTNDRDPVYRDSAMEAFLMFEPEKSDKGVYLILEANANGVILAGYGDKRVYRSYFPDAVYRDFQCRVEMKEDRWEASFCIPVSVLEQVYGHLNLGEGSVFTCNFYKISEDKSIEHYASYAPIESEIPSFHMPEFFEQAEITGRD